MTAIQLTTAIIIVGIVVALLYLAFTGRGVKFSLNPFHFEVSEKKEVALWELDENGDIMPAIIAKGGDGGEGGGGLGGGRGGDGGGVYIGH